MEIDGISMLLNNCIMVARQRRKKVQFVALEHFLKQGHQLIDFEKFEYYFSTCLEYGGVSGIDLAQKLICFGVADLF
jgi:hypothetical protein